MAKGDGKSLEKLYIELGLDLSQLQSDILAADKTVTENLGRLNRERNLIKIRMQADISGLDAAKDAAQILAIQEKSLNEQLSISKDRLAILEAAYKQVASNQNSTALAIQNAEKQWQRERIEVGKLEAALKSLASQKVSIDTAHVQDSISKLTAKIKNIKIQAEIDTSRLKDAGNIFDAQKTHIAAVTRELELQREKYYQLQRQATEAAKAFGGENSITLNLKSNFLQQYQEIQKLEQKLKELQSTNVNLQIKAENLQKVEQSINEKISRINATVDLIRVKTEVDMSKLGAAVSEFDKAKRQVTALNQELTLQNSKLAEMQKLLSQSSGTKAINLAADIQRQIQAIDQLKAKIKELNSIQPPKSGLLSGYLGIKGDIAGQLNNITSSFAQLKGATSSADNAIISVLGTIDAIPSPAGKAVAALAGLPIVFAGIENSIVDMMKAVAAGGDSVYVMSRGFQMSVKDTGKFTTMCKTAGVEVNDLASTLKRVQQQIVRGGDDARAEQWLRRYGESAFDANGKLKDLNEMTLTLSRALKQAQAEGRGMEFILATMRNASADAITAIEDAEGVYEQASHIVKAGLANPALAHELQGNLNALNVQSAQLGTSFKNALLPVANEIVPRMTERMGNLTRIISDNKDLILGFGRDFAQVWGNVEDTIDKIGEGLGVLAKLARENRVVRQTDQKTVVGRYKDATSVRSAEDIVKSEIANGGYTAEDVKKLRYRDDLYKKEIERANSDYKKLLEERRKVFATANKAILEKYKNDSSIKTATDLMNKLTDAEKEVIAAQPTEFFGSLMERVAALNLELQELNKTAAQSNQQLLETLNKANKIEGLRGVKGDTSPDISEDARKAYDEEWKQTREFTDELYKITHNEFDNKKFDLDKWYGDLVNRAELSEKEREALDKLYAEKSAQIEQERADKLAEIRDKIAAEDRTAFENRLADIEKEKQSWIQAGMDKIEADELAQKKREQLEKEVAEKVSDIRKSINAEFQTDLQNQIEKIQDEQQAWVDMGVAASEAAELAGQKMELAFEKAVDKAKSLNQSLEDKIFAQEHSQYETDIRKLQQEVAQKAQEYQKAGIFDENARALLNRYYNNALRDLNVKAGKGGDYTKSPTGANSGFQLINFGQQQQTFGTFTSEVKARNQVIQGLSQEQQALIESQEAIRDAATAQKELAQSAQKAEEGLQLIEGDKGASSSSSDRATIIEGDKVVQLSDKDAALMAKQQPIEIIHGDQISGSSNPIGKSFDEIIAEAFPKTELQQFSEQLNQTKDSLPIQDFQDAGTAAQEVSNAQIEQTKSAQKVTEEHGKLAETAARVKEAFEGVAEMKKSGLRDTDVTKSPTKSSLHGDYDQPREKVHLQTAPKDKSFLTLSDIGFDYDTAKDIFLTGAGMAATTGATGVGLALSPEILAGAVIAAIGGGVAKGTYDNRDERLNAPDKISLDDGTLANIDLSEISSPLSGIETNVQGIRDILQGNNAVEDANAEGLESTSENSSWSELLTPLNSIDETAKSILGELQSRQDENDLAAPINELKSEVSTQLSDGVSQISENLSSPIQELVKEMQTQKTAEVETQPKTATESTDYLTPLTAIRDNVASIWGKLQEQIQPQETTQTENLSEILSPITQNVNAPLSDLRAAIDNKQFTLPENLFPTEIIVQPLNTISQLIEKIISALSNREPPKIEISPNMDIDLGGAYVFDDNLKTELVNDITSNIVTRITEAVQSATASSSRNRGYGFGT